MDSVEPQLTATQGLETLAASIKSWGRELGFSDVRIADVDLADAEGGLAAWLAAGFHGEMDYMARHGMNRARPAALVPGTVRVIVARMDYLPPAAGARWRENDWASLDEAGRATVSRYAQGRDYHKVLRSRLARLAERLKAELGQLSYRVFTDSAPVLEVELARKAGIGWRGKHTLLLSRQGGSMYFIGEIFIDAPLPVDAAVSEHCGTCARCIDVCPTKAIVAPYRLDARRCIAYLTIELKGSIPTELRPLIGNRVFGCDDCQLACPWNKFAARATVTDFDARDLGGTSLAQLFAWDGPTFEARTEGTALRRIGHERWLRNLAVGLGNALRGPLPASLRSALRSALAARADHPSALVREHVSWALAQDGPLTS